MSIELLWTTICLAGMVVAGWGFRDSGRSIRTAEALLAETRLLQVPGITSAIVDAEDLLIIAQGYRRNETLRFLAHGVLLLLGMPAILNPEPVTISTFVTGLIAVNLFILSGSTGDAIDRWRIRRRKTNGK